MILTTWYANNIKNYIRVVNKILPPPPPPPQTKITTCLHVWLKTIRLTRKKRKSSSTCLVKTNKLRILFLYFSPSPIWPPGLSSSTRNYSLRFVFEFDCTPSVSQVLSAVGSATLPRCQFEPHISDESVPLRVFDFRTRV